VYLALQQYSQSGATLKYAVLVLSNLSLLLVTLVHEASDIQAQVTFVTLDNT
jgi:hypothetical protein